MKKKQKKIAIVLSIIFVILIIFLFLNNKKQFISVNYYDVDGNLIINSYSITIPATAYSFDLTVNVKNTGNLVLNCVPVIFSPSEFDSAMTRSNKVINPGQSEEWTSNRMVISNFLGRVNPQRFSATIQCYNQNYAQKTYLNQTGYIDLNIKTICGNKICETNETNSCPADCGPVCGNLICENNETNSCPNDCIKVKFRTNDLAYSLSGHAIAFSNTCGSSLIKLEYTSKYCSNAYTSTCPALVGTTLVFNASLPGNPRGTNPGSCLYSNSSNGQDYLLLWKISSTTNVMLCPNNIGTWNGYHYTRNDNSALVSGSTSVITPANELTCQG